jgi:5-(carboxyamino)imidazole ribonucleotide mutase
VGEPETAPASRPAPLAERSDEQPPAVAIVMSSRSEMPVMEKAAQELEERGIAFEVKVLPAHHDPDAVRDYARNARERGLRVIIAGSSYSATLPAMIAANTDLPVIGVPISGPHSIAGGFDGLAAIAQMPPGMPVAAVGVNQAINAAVLATRILHA